MRHAAGAAYTAPGFGWDGEHIRMDFETALAQLHTLFMVASFVLGCLLGSFANVCVSRWPSGESVVSPRSRCPKCKNAIAWYDNIPILSWLILGAKCRHCKSPISWQYPAVEAITGLLFLAVYWRHGFTLATPVYMLFSFALVVVTFQDLADWTIPNEITFPGIPLGIACSLLGMVFAGSGLRVVQPTDAVLGALLGGGIIYSLDIITQVLLKKPGMGFGDVKLLAMIGALLGWKGALFTVVGASFIGSIVGVGMILYFRSRKGDEAPEDEATTDEIEYDENGEPVVTLEGHYLPFGPYLAMAGWIYMLVGLEIWNWYFGLLQQPEMPGLNL